jgi:tetratricopeptide (TPR) repeat protein
MGGHDDTLRPVRIVNRIARISLLTLAAFLFLATSAAAQQESRKPIETIADIPRTGRLARFKAQEQKDRGDFEAAANILAEFLQKHPGEDHFLIRYNYGNTLAQLDKPEQALEQYRAAVKMEDRYWQAWLNLGETAYNLGTYAEAAAAITKGYDLAGEKQPRVLYFAGAAWLMAGDYAQAKSLLERLVAGPAEGQQLDWYRALIMACIELGDGDAGRKAVDRMLGLFPADPDAWDLAFQFAASRQEYRRAAVALTVRSYLEPLEERERRQLGALYAAIELPYLAGKWFEAALTDSSTADDYERLASMYLAAHEQEHALATLEQALAKDPTPKLWSLLGDLYYMDRRYDRAYDAFEKCWQLDPLNGRAALMLGYCALELGRTDEAIPYLKKAAEFPDYAGNAQALLRRALQSSGG